MGIKGLPTTYDGYLGCSRLRARAVRVHPANRRVTEATIRIAQGRRARGTSARFRRVSIALMDEPLRVALGMEKQPPWLVRAVHLGLRLRAGSLRFVPPRRTAYHHGRPRTPTATPLADIGPPRCSTT